MALQILCVYSGFISVLIFVTFVWSISELSVAKQISFFKICEPVKICKNSVEYFKICKIKKMEFYFVGVHFSV